MGRQGSWRVWSRKLWRNRVGHSPLCPDSDAGVLKAGPPAPQRNAQRTKVVLQPSALGPGGRDAASPNRWGDSTSQPSTLRANATPAPGLRGDPVSQLQLAHTDWSGDPRGHLPCPARSSTILSHTLGARKSGLCSVNGPGPGGRPDTQRTGLFPNPTLGHGPAGSHLGDEDG